MGVTTLIEYTDPKLENIEYIVNETKSNAGSYIYLRWFNVVGGIIATESGNLNLTDLNSSPAQNCRIYSNGASDVYFTP